MAFAATLCDWASLLMVPSSDENRRDRKERIPALPCTAAYFLQPLTSQGDTKPVFDNALVPQRTFMNRHLGCWYFGRAIRQSKTPSPEAESRKPHEPLLRQLRGHHAN